MPPATDASKASATPFFSASAASSSAVRGEQRLVGGDDGLAGASAVSTHGAPALRAADQLDEQVDVRRAPASATGIGEKVAARQIGVALLAGVARRDRGDHDFLPPRARGERVRLAGQ